MILKEAVMENASFIKNRGTKHKYVLSRATGKWDKGKGRGLISLFVRMKAIADCEVVAVSERAVIDRGYRRELRVRDRARGSRVPRSTRDMSTMN
eukprot:640588-Pleurochrysis_carterae.AAC.3